MPQDTYPPKIRQHSNAKDTQFLVTLQNTSLGSCIVQRSLPACGMIIFPNEDDFSDIHEILAEAEENTQFDMLAGIECDQDDKDTQVAQGENDPISVLEIVLQWHEESHVGIVDWFFARESTIEDEEPHIEHGGPLLAFRYTEDEPDYDSLLKHAVPRLNQEIKWASFDTEELDSEEDSE